MATWKPDPTFYPSPKMAMEAPAEKLAYVAMLNPTLKGRPDAMGIVDVDERSKTYGKSEESIPLPLSDTTILAYSLSASTFTVISP